MLRPCKSVLLWPTFMQISWVTHRRLSSFVSCVCECSQLHCIIFFPLYPTKDRCHLEPVVHAAEHQWHASDTQFGSFLFPHIYRLRNGTFPGCSRVQKRNRMGDSQSQRKNTHCRRHLAWFHATSSTSVPLPQPWSQSLQSSRINPSQG
jgi:hypothetical protein